ncbi:MAG: type II toxin-antitoxin system RelE/ParE family toxin [Bacillota bacterium]
MKCRVEFLQTALDDLEEIVLYIAKDSKAVAMKMHDKLVASVYRLATFPKLGILVPDKKMREAGFRMLIIEKYLLFYKFYNEIIILRVAHGVRDYPRLLESQSNNACKEE